MSSHALAFRTCFIALCVAGCAKESADEEAAPTAVNVQTALVTSQAFAEKVGALGTIAGEPGRTASLSAPGPTRVTQVLVALGQPVAQGQALVALDATTFRETATSATARMNAAGHAYDRAKSLAASGILPRKDVEQASADLATARADVVVARKALSLSTLRSPISGIVAGISAAIGASADVNQPLVEIVDPRGLDIVLGMTPADAGKVHVGNTVELRSGQSSTAERLGVATVKSISPALDSVSRNVPVRAVAQTTVRMLRIGETVYGEVAVATHANAITIPQEALVPEGDGFRVFVVDAKNVAHARPVIVGARDARTAEILSGLTAGLRVVTTGAYGLEDGATVIPGK